MTTATPARVTIASVENIADDPQSRKELLTGLKEATAGWSVAEIDELFDEMPQRFTEPAVAQPWSKLVDEAVEEVIDEVAALLTAAVRRRLPFEWEGPELYRP